MAILLWFAVAGMAAFWIAPASVMSVVSRDLAISSTGVSWLVSIFIIGMTALSLPAGMILDRRDNRLAILVMAVSFFGCTVWAWVAGTAGDFWSLMAARFLSGGVEVIFWIASINLVGTAFLESRQGTAIGFMLTSIPGGFAIAHMTTPILADIVGWQRSFLVFGGWALIAAVVFCIYSRGIDIRTHISTPTREDFVTVFRNRWVWAVGAIGFSAFSLNLFFNNWLPTYLVDEFGFSLAQGGIFAAVFPAIGAVARIVSGSISDRLMGGRRKPIVFGSFVAIAPLVVLIALVRTVGLLIVVLVIAGFVTQMGLALLLPYVRELVDPHVAGTALSVLNLVGFVGAFSAPIITGVIIERTGGYTMAFVYATVLAVIGVVLAWIVPDTVQSKSISHSR